MFIGEYGLVAATAKGSEPSIGLTHGIPKGEKFGDVVTLYYNGEVLAFFKENPGHVTLTVFGYNHMIDRNRYFESKGRDAMILSHLLMILESKKDTKSLFRRGAIEHVRRLFEEGYYENAFENIREESEI